VINATGCLNNRKWPEIAGLKDFEGKLLHSANSDESW
jgi:cation diffusion facilitator CzcD-associated flavoprotein CzcO